MGIINRTSLATSSPLNLTRGFGFFPANTSINNPTPPTIIGLGGVPTTSITLINTNLPLGLWRFRASLTGSLAIGVFFGYNLGYTVEGETLSSGTAILRVSGDSAQGGAGFGLGFTLSFAFSVEAANVSFSLARGFTTTWSRVFNFSASATIDLIVILLQVLRASGINVPLEQIGTARSIAGSGAIWGLYGSASSQFATQGQLTFRPTLTVSGNILALIPQLRATLKAIKKAGGKVSVGPQLNIIFPVTIRMVRLTTEDGNYAEDGFGSGVLRFSGGPTIPANAPPVRSLSIVHTHTIGLRFSLEFKASVSMWSIFSASASIAIPLGSALEVQPLGANRVLGPYFTTLNNSQNLAMSDLPEVAWG